MQFFPGTEFFQEGGVGPCGFVDDHQVFFLAVVMFFEEAAEVFEVSLVGEGMDMVAIIEGKRIFLETSTRGKNSA